MALGVPEFNPTLSRQAMSMQSDLLQGLGRQIKADINTVVTNRQLKGLAQGLQSVDTTSPQFGRQIVGLMSEYPLAVQSPIGQAAITQLGSEFKLNQQKEIAREAFGNRLGMEVLRDYSNNRPYGAPPMTRSEAEAVVGGSSPQLNLPSGPAATGAPGAVYQPTGPLETLPVAGSTDLFGDKQFLQQTGGQPSIPAAPTSGISGIPQPAPVSAMDRMGSQLKAYSERLKADPSIREPEAKFLMDTYRDALRAQMRPSAMGRPIETQQGLATVGPDGVVRPLQFEGGGTVTKPTSDNTAADNARADASLKLREATANRTRAERVLKEMKDTGVNSPGPWEEDGNWYHNTNQGREKITPVMAKRWMDLNHEYTQAENAYKQAMSGGGGAVAVDAKATPAGEIVSVTSAAEAMSLPRGTKFRDPSGNIRIVP